MVSNKRNFGKSKTAVINTDPPFTETLKPSMHGGDSASSQESTGHTTVTTVLVSRGSGSSSALESSLVLMQTLEQSVTAQIF